MGITMPNDADLIKKFQSGHVESFDTLIRPYLQEIYQYFFAIVYNAEDAEDLTQTALLKLFKGLKSFRFEAEFRTYLYTVNTNVARGFLRKKKLREIFSNQEMPDMEIHDTTSPSDTIEQGVLWRIIDKLPARQKLVTILRLVQRLSFNDIGNILGMRPDTAKVNYHYAIQTIRKSMGSTNGY